MKSIEEIGNKAFLNGKQPNGSTGSVSSPPLFIGTRGREETVEEKVKWKTRRVCLRYGERFQWKNRCGRCRYLITFQVRLN